MKRTAVIVAVCLITASAHAEILLMEIHHTGSNTFTSLGDPTPFELLAYIDTIHDATVFGGLHGAADVGQMYVVSPNQVAEFHSILASGDDGARLMFNTAQGQANGTIIDVSAIWTVPSFVLQINYYVPPRGVGFAGYHITGITQTIDDYRQQRGLSTLSTGGDQTIRIYGEAVPEPASWLLVTIAGLAWFFCLRNNFPSAH